MLAGRTGAAIDNRAAEDRAGCMSLTAAPMHRIGEGEFA
jgi:hypothetical protein